MIAFFSQNRFQSAVLAYALVFVLIINFVAFYKLFSLLITCYLCGILSYWFIDFIIDLALRCDKFDESEHGEINKSNLAKFLFRNETFYKLIKHLNTNKTYLKNEFKQIFQTNSSTARKLSSSPRSIKGNEPVKKDLNIALEINMFTRNCTANFIESWYVPSISANEQFPREAQLEMECLFNDLFYLIAGIDRLNLFAQMLNLVNKNFLNFAIDFSLNKSLSIDKFNVDQLHPALRNMPLSEQAYLKRCVQLILRKSMASNSNLSHPLIEEMFMQLIGKNCLEKVTSLFEEPKFLYYIICLMLNSELTKKELSKEKPDASQTDQHAENSAKNLIHIDPLIQSIESNTPIEQNNSNKSGADKFDHNLYQEFNEKNLNSFKSFTYSTSSYTNTTLDTHIFKLEIINTKTNYELKTGKKFTSYNIQVATYNVNLIQIK